MPRPIPPPASPHNTAGPLNIPQDGPEAACDRIQFDQPEPPKMEAGRSNDPDGDYIFIRSLYETRRMRYGLYNATGTRTPDAPGR